MRIEGLGSRVYAVSFEGRTDFGDDQLRAVASALARVRAQSLDVSHTSVSDSSIETLSGLASVTHLNIAGSRMTGRGVFELAAKSPSLEAIFVDSNQASALTVADLMSPRHRAKIMLSPLEPRFERSDAADPVEPD